MKFLFFFLLTTSLNAQMFINTDPNLVFGPEQTDTVKIMYLEKDTLLEGTLYRKYRVCILDKTKTYEGERFKVDDIPVNKNGEKIKSLFIVKRERLISLGASRINLQFAN